MPSFDIVSKTDLSEIDNALANMTREMSQRYDFKGSQSRIERKEAEILGHGPEAAPAVVEVLQRIGVA